MWKGRKREGATVRSFQSPEDSTGSSSTGSSSDGEEYSSSLIVVSLDRSQYPAMFMQVLRDFEEEKIKGVKV